MADNKNGREAQAQNEVRRQRERAIAEELERADEPEPPVDPTGPTPSRISCRTRISRPSNRRPRSGRGSSGRRWLGR